MYTAYTAYIAKLLTLLTLLCSGIYAIWLEGYGVRLFGLWSKKAECSGRKGVDINLNGSLDNQTTSGADNWHNKLKTTLCLVHWLCTESKLDCKRIWLWGEKEWGSGRDAGDVQQGKALKGVRRLSRRCTSRYWKEWSSGRPLEIWVQMSGLGDRGVKPG